MKIVAYLLLMLLTACVNAPIQQKHPSKACLEYQQMMTAPMPREAMQKLQKKCLESKE